MTSNPDRVVAVVECAAGNESVGTEWVETAIFPANATLEAVLSWREGCPIKKAG